MPGNSLYSEIVRYSHKFFIVGTGMAKGLKVKEMNRNLNNNSARVRYFPGTTVKRLHHYVIPMLTDDTLDTIIIQSGCNDIYNRNSNPKDIAKAIGSLGNRCRSHGVNQVLISSLICRKNFHLNNNIKRINFLLKLICQKNGFVQSRYEV